MGPECFHTSPPKHLHTLHHDGRAPEIKQIHISVKVELRPISAEAMQRMESQRGAMTCSVWCLESSSRSRWPPLVPIQRVAALCTSRAFTRAQDGAASVGRSTSLPCLPLQPESCLREEGDSLINCCCQTLIYCKTETANNRIHYKKRMTILFDLF